jgi:hypothetical protein
MEATKLKKHAFPFSKKFFEGGVGGTMFAAFGLA